MVSSILSFIERLSFSDESDLRKYIPKYRKKLLPYNLRISSLDRVVQYFIKKGFSEIVFLLQCTIVIGLLFLYIVSEYWHHVSVYIVDCLFSLVYISLMILTFILSDRRGQYLCLPFTIIDVLTIIPTVIITLIDIVRVFIYLDMHSTMEGASFWIELPYFRLISLLRIGAIVQLYFHRRSRGKVFTALTILVYIITLLIVSSGMIMLFENERFPVSFLTDTNGFATLMPLQFHDAAYFIASGITTVGFGDFTPHSLVGKILFCLLICIVILASLGKFKEIYFIFSSQKIIMYDFTHDMSKHIIITGSGKATDIFEFWKEFFDESHGKIYTKRIVVVINNMKEYAILRELAGQSYFRERVTLICDDITNFDVLKRVKAERCSGVFILVNSVSTDPAAEDTDALMKLLSIKNYDSNIDVYTQYFLHSNAGLFKTSGAKVSICLQYFEQRILGLNTYAQGAATLLANLVSSGSKNTFFRSQLKESHEDSWILNYNLSCIPKIHVVPLSKSFIGVPFHKAAEVIYEHFDIVLVGLCTSSFEFLLNPHRGNDSYYIREGERAVVIARSHFHAQAVVLCHAPDSLSIFKVIRSKKPEEANISARSASQHIEPTAPQKWLNRKRLGLFRNAISKVVDIQQKNRSILQSRKDQRLYSAYIRDTPLTKESFFMKSAKHFSNHIVVFVSNFEFAISIGLYQRSIFISPEMVKPVIFFIHPSDRSRPELKQLYEEFSIIKDIHAIFGDFHCQKDIELVAVDSASSVLFATNIGQSFSYTSGYSADENAPIASSVSTLLKTAPQRKKRGGGYSIVDANTIHIALSLESISPTTPYLASILDRRNIKFFLRENSIKLSRKKSVFQFLRVAEVDEEFESYCNSSKHCASGKVFTRAFFTTFLCQTFFTSELVDIIDGLCGYNATSEALEDLQLPVMSIHVVKPEEDLIGLEYREVYAHFLKKRIVCVGLYRYHSPTFSYIFCNPPAFSKVLPQDLIYLIGNYETATRKLKNTDLTEKAEFEHPSARANPEAPNQKFPIVAPSPSSILAISPNAKILSSFSASASRYDIVDPPHGLQSTI